MTFSFETRTPESPVIEQIWRATSNDPGSFVSVASNYWEIVMSGHGRGRSITVRGPATQPTQLAYQDGGEWVGIRFRLGSLLLGLPVNALVDRDIQLPPAGQRGFLLAGSAWSLPDYENADSFVERLIRQGHLVQDPSVDALLRGDIGELAPRSAQRHFRQVTGLSQRTARQIGRARQAMHLLQHGASILDATHDAGYYDQAHLCRSFRRWLGQTPTTIEAGTYPG